MCGRYSLTSQEGVAQELDLAFAEPDAPSEWWRARYNIAPTQPAPVLANRDRPRQLEMMRWGLVPPWADSLKVGARWINARAETAATAKAFRDALRRRRCLVPADGFFEWAGEGAAKQPYFVHRAGRAPFAFGGLWERWKGPDGLWVISFAILTTRPNPLIAPIHDRMPVVIPPDAYARWLSPDELPPDAIADLLAPWPVAGWEATRVSSHVNKPANDDPACVAPVGD
jgi:putative SOS response-associated peptidase YedK